MNEGEAEMPMGRDEIERTEDRLVEIARDALAMCDWDRENRDRRIGVDPTNSYLQGSNETGIYPNCVTDKKTAAFNAVMNEHENADPAFADALARLVRHRMAEGDVRGRASDNSLTGAWNAIEGRAMETAREQLERDGVPPGLQDPSRRIDANVPLTSHVDEPCFNIAQAVKVARHELGVFRNDANGIGEKAAIARLLYVHVPNAHIMRDRVDSMMDHRPHMRDPLLRLHDDTRGNMLEGDFSQARHDARMARRSATWMAPMLSNTTKELIGVGPSSEQSIVSKLFDEVGAQVAEAHARAGSTRVKGAEWLAALTMQRA